MVDVIRAATTQDYVQVCVLFAEGDAFHAHALPQRFRLGVPLSSESSFVGELANPERVLLVAAAGHDLLGLVAGHLVTLGDHPSIVSRRFATIDSLIVMKAYQRRGIGRRLMTGIEQWARALSVPTLELNVFAFNHSAIHLYEELGYHIVSQRMEKSLSEEVGGS